MISGRTSCAHKGVRPLSSKQPSRLQGALSSRQSVGDATEPLNPVCVFAFAPVPRLRPSLCNNARRARIMLESTYLFSRNTECELLSRALDLAIFALSLPPLPRAARLVPEGQGAVAIVPSRPVNREEGVKEQSIESRTVHCVRHQKHGSGVECRACQLVRSVFSLHAEKPRSK